MKGRQRRQAGQTWTRPGQNPHEAKRPTAPCPWRGQAGHTDPDKAWTRPGQEDDARQEDSSNTKGRHSSQPRPEDGRNTRGGHLGLRARPKEQEDTRRTAGGHQDKRRTQGWPAWPKDNRRTTARGQQQAGQEEDKTRTQARTQTSGARPASVTSYFFL